MTIAEHPYRENIKRMEITYRPLGFMRAQQKREVNRDFFAALGFRDVADAVNKIVELPCQETTRFVMVEILAVRAVREGQ